MDSMNENNVMFGNTEMSAEMAEQLGLGSSEVRPVDQSAPLTPRDELEAVQHQAEQKDELSDDDRELMADIEADIADSGEAWNEAFSKAGEDTVTEVLTEVMEAGTDNSVEAAREKATAAGVSHDAQDAIAIAIEAQANKLLMGTGVTTEDFRWKAPDHIREAAIKASIAGDRAGLRALAALYRGELT
ncbi:hypothetical protein IWQ49_003062 [Labrenzia sp. EL_126]|nr:hypothetical protein [Labrenzia sp. EL_126]